MATTTAHDPHIAVDDLGDIEIDLTTRADPFGPAPAQVRNRDLLPPGRWYEVSWPVVSLSTWLYAVIGFASLLTILALANALSGEPACIGCDSVQRVGISRSLTTDALAVRFASCGSEAVQSVSVASAGTGDILWAATASPPVAADTIVVGQVTGAMTETVALTDPLPTGDLIVVVEADSRHALTFTTAKVRPNKVYWDGLLWSSSGFESAVRSAGGCADWIGPLGRTAGSAIQWGILIGALGIAGLAATRVGREESADLF